jgi:hypothetical protein
MSADNWAICPKCKRDADADKARKFADARAKYGKIQQDEYLKLLGESEAPTEYGETLREDWELGTDEDGLFSVRYDSHCSACGFKFSFNKKIDVLP